MVGGDAGDVDGREVARVGGRWTVGNLGDDGTDIGNGLGT